MEIFPGIQAFEWDRGNKEKNFLAHRVTQEECEEAFFDESKRTLRDSLHSRAEKRHILIGRTKKDRLLFIVFTVRRSMVRIISARDLNKKEYSLYEKKA